MKNPYQKKLEKLLGKEIILHRREASALNGKVDETDDDGCTIVIKEKEMPEGVLFVFVAYEDIRGIGRTDWDFDVIA